VVAIKSSPSIEKYLLTQLCNIRPDLLSNRYPAFETGPCAFGTMSEEEVRADAIDGEAGLISGEMWLFSIKVCIYRYSRISH
jgi:hypothetical protein